MMCGNSIVITLREEIVCFSADEIVSRVPTSCHETILFVPAADQDILICPKMASFHSYQYIGHENHFSCGPI